MISKQEMDRVCGMWVDKETAPFRLRSGILQERL
jgi:YHS domain-containing protein